MDTPSKTPEKKSRWLTRGVFGIGLASLCSDWGHEIGTSLLPILLAGLGAPAYALGILEGVADGVSSFAKLAGGWVADRPHLRKPVAVAGYLLTGLSTFAFGFVGDWPQILASRAIGWMGRGIRGPARDVLLTDAVAPELVGRAFGFERTMDTIGAILGPLCATALIAMMSVRMAMRWTLLPGALAAVAIATLVPSGVRDGGHHALPFTTSLSRLPREFRRFLKCVALFGLGDFAHTLLILRAVQLLTPQYGIVRAGGIAVALYTFHNVIYAAASYPAGLWGQTWTTRNFGGGIFIGGGYVHWIYLRAGAPAGVNRIVWAGGILRGDSGHTGEKCGSGIIAARNSGHWIWSAGDSQRRWRFFLEHHRGISLDGSFACGRIYLCRGADFDGGIASAI